MLIFLNQIDQRQHTTGLQRGTQDILKVLQAVGFSREAGQFASTGQSQLQLNWCLIQSKTKLIPDGY